MFRWAAVILALPSTLALANGSFVSVAPRILAFGVEPYNSPTSDVRNGTTYYIGEGVQAEYGLTRSDFTLYAGANYDYAHKTKVNSFSYSNYHYRTDEHWAWHSGRMIAGVRLNPLDLNPNPVKPLIGIHASYGWLKRTKSEEHNEQFNGQTVSSVSVKASQSSKGSFGYGVELGLMVVISSSVRVGLLTGYDNLGIALPHDDT